MIITAGKTNVSVYFYIVGDASHASPGNPITGLLFSDIETGGSASYTRQGAARVDLTLITLASASAAHSDGGFIEVDATNMPGVYRCDYPDAAFVTGVDQVILQLVAAAANNAAIAPIMADITDLDLRNNSIYDKTLHLDYLGGMGYGVWLDATAANTNTVEGTDGTHENPVSTLAAAKTLATAIGTELYYIKGDSFFSVDATYTDWTWCGIGHKTGNVINLNSQNVDGNRFINLTLEGDQGGTVRIQAEDCALQDPGAGTTTLHIHAVHCGIVDDITVDTSNDNVFESCFSLVGGTVAPIVRASGASGTVVFTDQRGGLDIYSLSASHNLSVHIIGQVIFDATCNVNATVALRGIGSLTDNTAGMSNLNQDAFINMLKINTECDTALIDYAPNTVIPDAAGVAPTAVEIRQEMDANSVDLNTLVTQIGTAGAGLTDLGGMSTGMKAEILAEVVKVLVTQMTESYAADGVAPTPAQSLMLIQQMLTDFAISGVTMTVKKIDGTTTAATFTLDSASAPTSITRTT